MKIYVDDMLIKRRSIFDHIDNLEDNFNTPHFYEMKLNLVKCAFGVTSKIFLSLMVLRKSIEANPKKNKWFKR